MSHPRITTPRLLLREYRRSDVDAVAAYASREEFYRFLPIPVPTHETAREFVKERVSEVLIEVPGSFTFAIESAVLRRMIGDVRITTTSDADRAGSIGYALDPDYWGCGYMTEAVAAVLRFGFEQMRLHRIWATADPENVASWRLMERVGMRREGLMRDDKLVRGAWRDSYLYAIISTDPAGPAV